MKLFKYFMLLFLGWFSIRGLGVSAYKLDMLYLAAIYTICGCALIFSVIVMVAKDYTDRRL